MVLGLWPAIPGRGEGGGKGGSRLKRNGFAEAPQAPGKPWTLTR